MPPNNGAGVLPNGWPGWVIVSMAAIHIKRSPEDETSWRLRADFICRKLPKKENNEKEKKDCKIFFSRHRLKSTAMGHLMRIYGCIQQDTLRKAYPVRPVLSLQQHPQQDLWQSVPSWHSLLPASRPLSTR